MVRYRLSGPARADIESTLRTSEEVHGALARIRYRALLTATFRRVAVAPFSPLTIDRSYLQAGLRSLHTRHGRGDSREAPVNDPVHVVYFRATDSGFVEIARVLHEQMEPRRHLATDDAQ
ncbi:hypothetical protein STVA_12490 [Allostella vacuolata]|nr:hypothetical protein STVA_12490 [Stella vacuolata]